MYKDIKKLVDTNESFVVTGPSRYGKSFFLRNYIALKNKTSEIITLINYNDIEGWNLIKNSTADIIIIESWCEIGEEFFNQMSVTLKQKQLIFCVYSKDQNSACVSPFYDKTKNKLWNWVLENNINTVEVTQSTHDIMMNKSEIKIEKDDVNQAFPILEENQLFITLYPTGQKTIELQPLS